MSVTDYNQGLLVGLVLNSNDKGDILAMYTPKSVTNSNTSSVTIDFGKTITDLEMNQSLKDFFFISTFVTTTTKFNCDSWTRVDSTTITFNTDDYFSCNGYLMIIYDSNNGTITDLESFAYEFLPDGVPYILLLAEPLVSPIFSFTQLVDFTIYAENITNELRTPTQSSLSESISSKVITRTSSYTITYGLSDSYQNTILS